MKRCKACGSLIPDEDDLETKRRTDEHNARVDERWAGGRRTPISPRYTDLPEEKRPEWAQPDDA